MKNMKLPLFVLIGSLALAGAAHAQTFDITFTGNGVTGIGSVNTVDIGGGNFAGTSGVFTLLTWPGSTAPITLTLDAAGTPGDEVTLANILNSGGGNLSGDNIMGPGFISGEGLVFALPATSGSPNPFGGDGVNIFAVGGGNYEIAYFGPDFPAGQPTDIGTVTFTQAAPEPSSWVLGLLAGGALLVLRRRALRA